MRLLALTIVFFASVATAADPVSIRVIQSSGTELVVATDDIAQMPQRRIETTTPWTIGPQVFEGPDLCVFLDRVGLRAATVRVYAVNDYFATLPRSDCETERPILAYLRNGAPMSVRDKGPYWIIYDFDATDEERAFLSRERAVWQVVRFDDGE